MFSDYRVDDPNGNARFGQSLSQGLISASNSISNAIISKANQKAAIAEADKQRTFTASQAAAQRSLQSDLVRQQAERDAIRDLISAGGTSPQQMELTAQKKAAPGVFAEAQPVIAELRPQYRSLSQGLIGSNDAAIRSDTPAVISTSEPAPRRTLSQGFLDADKYRTPTVLGAQRPGVRSDVVIDVPPTDYQIQRSLSSSLASERDAIEGRLLPEEERLTEAEAVLAKPDYTLPEMASQNLQRKVAQERQTQLEIADAAVRAEAARNTRELNEATRNDVYKLGYTPEIIPALPPAAREIAAQDPEFRQQGNSEKMHGYVKRYNDQQVALRAARANQTTKDAGDRIVVGQLANNYQEDTKDLGLAISQQIPILHASLAELEKNPNDNNAAQAAVKVYIKLYDKGLVTNDEFVMAGQQAGLDLPSMYERWKKGAGSNILAETSADEIRRGAHVMESVLRGALQAQNDRYTKTAKANGIDDTARIGLIDAYQVAPKKPVVVAEAPDELHLPDGRRFKKNAAGQYDEVK